MLDFWIRVKEELEFKNILQKELAKQINESYNTIQSWITKDRFPNASQAVKIAKALNITVEELVEGRKNKKDFQKSDLAGKFLSIFSSLSENDQKSVIALIEEMQRHKE